MKAPPNVKPFTPCSSLLSASNICAASCKEGDANTSMAPFPGWYAVIWNRFIPRPGRIVAERNSGLFAPEVGLRSSRTTCCPPICRELGGLAESVSDAECFPPDAATIAAAKAIEDDDEVLYQPKRMSATR